MKFSHPFAWLPVTIQWRAFVGLTCMTLVVMYCLGRLNRDLRTSAAPHGIISFELAGNLATINQQLNEWQPADKISAGLSLGLDYLYMPLYAAAIALGCALVSRSAGQLWASLGNLLAWAQFGAAVLDAAENYALIQLLNGAQLEFWPILARNCALLKFALVALGLLFVVVAATLQLWRRRGTNMPQKS